MAVKYATVSTLQDRLGESPGAVSLLTDAVALAEKKIDDWVGYVISPTTTGAKTFNGANSEYLWLPHFTALTKVEFLDSEGTSVQTLSATTDYIAEPVNATQKTHIAFRGRGIWPSVDRLIQVTATWGYSTVPIDVVEAVYLLAANMYQARNLPFGILGENVMGHTVRYSPSRCTFTEDVAQLLVPYRWFSANVRTGVVVG